jgi:hypothetical protein
MASGDDKAAQQAEHVAAPTTKVQCSIIPCQRGAVHTGRKADKVFYRHIPRIRAPTSTRSWRCCSPVPSRPAVPRHEQRSKNSSRLAGIKRVRDA